MATTLLSSVRVRSVLANEAVMEKKMTKNEVSYNNSRVTRPQPGILAVNPKPRKGLASKVIDFAEQLMVKLMHEHDLSSKHLHYMTGNYAPVPSEIPPVNNLPVTGHLPDCLNGMFMRIGPNPRFSPVAGYHWFDGDGMIHGLHIKHGKVAYVSRYVKTSRFLQEEFFGCAIFGKIGDLKGPLGVLVVLTQMLRASQKVIDISYGFGTGNTALVYHNKRLLALYELDKPYGVKVLEDGDLQTLGIVDYDKRLTHAFSAHPKIDPVTGEMFTFGCSLTHPNVKYRVVSKDGFMHDPVEITIPKCTLMLDFAISESYAIFMDLPMYFQPVRAMVKENRMAYVFDSTKKAKFGILPRYAKTEKEIKWFELPSCFIFHNANAWEEGNEVVLITSRCQNPNIEMFGRYLKDKVIPRNFRCELYEMRFNMITAASQKKLTESTFDFPEINLNYVGRKNRYVYGTLMDSTGKIIGIGKIDLHAKPEEGKQRIEVGGNVKGIYRMGAGKFGSVAVFVPREHCIASDEDDGYLVFFVHDENIERSYVYVIDAKTMSAEPVAVVDLPNRVPYGFHALFIDEEQIHGQARV